MDPLLKESQELSKEIIRHRRHLHQHAECGLKLPNTCAYITRTLDEYGYQPQSIGGGVVAIIGNDTPCLMLRADIDALPQHEESGLPFASEGLACHSCGHDAHAAMLLGAARILKSHEQELKGTVKLLFQPGEETLKGAKQMIAAGVLEHPHVDAAMALHMNFGACGYEPHTGTISFSPVMASADEFQITVHGESTHGSSPHLGCSALSIAANIIVSVQQLLALEIPSDDSSVLSFGMMESGKASNIIPHTAVLKGSIRTFSRRSRDTLKDRLVQLATSVASQWKASAEVAFPNEVPPNQSDPKLAEEMLGYCRLIADQVIDIPPIKGSEDFAFYGDYVPTFFANICAGGPSDGYQYSMHHPKASFDEGALPYGTAALAACALGWLENHA